MLNYAAITIGPIDDTLSVAGSPGTIWCASTMFSRLAGDLCESILNSIPGAEIVVPAYNKGFISTDGIGRFHDRIFFTCELERETLADKLETLCKDAKATLAKHISDALGQQDKTTLLNTKSYISGFIQLNWMISDKLTAEANNKNCILNLSKYLDCMELNTHRFNEETKSPIIQLLNGTSDSSNYYIYRGRSAGKTNACWLIPEKPADGAFQLLKNGTIRDIKNIANPFDVKDGRKIHDYFAVVQSDGDNMGDFLAACPPEQVREFSKCCIEYAAEAAKQIGAYGGLTIYAGGDDLLFLAPLEGKDGEKLLTLCSKLSSGFIERFTKLGNILCGVETPTLSFGISVNYESSPLYEALENAKHLLFEHAKTGMKNQIALSMHKHSGQSVFLLLPNNNEIDSPIFKLIDLLNSQAIKDTERADNALHSVVYHLEVFRQLFLESRRNNMDIQNLYDNLFDSAAHDMGREYINKIKRLGDAVFAFPSCRADNGKTIITDEAVDVLTSMLRFAKLHTERGGKK